jgi:AraC family ethanolamine operon transcriptional activator
VCERSLRYAFRDLLDTTPTAYLKAQRLNRAHHALRQADPSRVLVKQVALANGFWHLGQFAADYKRLFGESPSETLASG